jgi:nitroimidazol reductase NimA-like FMN-containing flavoprotein (pyridoxamine 5'-phosphate oxidase superfamily)
MVNPRDATRIQELDAEQCRRLLATQEVGRLGFISNGHPEVLPVNYVLDGDAVLFTTSPGSKLWGASCAPVAFEVDSVDSATRSGWSVVVHGVAQEITSDDTASVRDRLAAVAPSPWPGGSAHNLVRLPTTSITGRRVGNR